MSEEEGTYITDRRSIDEMERLIGQGAALTIGTGGVLSEISDLSGIHDVLDIACGPGEWSLELVKQYPDTHMVGVDISERMIKYAHVQAEAERLSIEYQVMDVTKGLKFPDNSFDLVNARFLMAFLLKEKWGDLLAEIKRILRPSGIVRLTEQESIITTDPGVEHYAQWWTSAFHYSGHTFAQTTQAVHNCIGLMLPRLLSQAGFTNRRHHSYAIDYSSGEPAHEPALRDVAEAFKVGEKFLRKNLPDLQLEHEDIMRAHEYMLSCIDKPEFVGFWHVITAIGQKPTQ